MHLYYKPSVEVASHSALRAGLKAMVKGMMENWLQEKGLTDRKGSRGIS